MKKITLIACQDHRAIGSATTFSDTIISGYYDIIDQCVYDFILLSENKYLMFSQEAVEGM